MSTSSPGRSGRPSTFMTTCGPSAEASWSTTGRCPPAARPNRRGDMSDKRLANKVAIVTGSSRGIGKAIAERFAAEGAKVTVNWVGREREAQAVVDSIKKGGGDALSVRADVSSSGDVRELVRATVDRFGRVDILVNNAGVMFTKSVLETNEDDWDRTIDINLKGAYLCAKEVAPIMLQQKAGKIINMSSNSGLYHPSAMRFTEYVVSKAGMNGLTKAMADARRDRGCRAVPGVEGRRLHHRGAADRRGRARHALSSGHFQSLDKSV